MSVTVKRLLKLCRVNANSSLTGAVESPVAKLQMRVHPFQRRMQISGHKELHSAVPRSRSHCQRDETQASQGQRSKPGIQTHDADTLFVSDRIAEDENIHQS